MKWLCLSHRRLWSDCVNLLQIDFLIVKWLCLSYCRHACILWSECVYPIVDISSNCEAIVYMYCRYMYTIKFWSDFVHRIVDMTPFDKPFPGLHEERFFRCSVCLFTCDSERLLALHFQQEDRHGYLLSCSKCGKVFNTQNRYDRHKHINCPVCCKSVSSESKLKQHMLWHQSQTESQFKCRICKKKKTFKYDKTRLRHELQCGKNNQEIW